MARGERTVGGLSTKAMEMLLETAGTRPHREEQEAAQHAIYYLLEARKMLCLYEGNPRRGLTRTDCLAKADGLSVEM